MPAVTTEKRGEILVITLNNPPVNALANDVRIGLVAALDEAAGDDSVRALVIHGAGKAFSAGADIAEFATGLKEPGLPEVVDRIEGSAKPVVAAIHRTCFGGGLEVALGCHYRVAAPSAKLGLPEVKLGLLPGAGGTQRLPRLVGVEAALPLIAIGNPIGADRAQEIGLLDRVVAEDDLVAGAVAFAKEIADARPIPRTGDRTEGIEGVDPSVYDDFLTKNGRKMKGFRAPNACVEAIRAATELPLGEGLEKERALFGELMMGDQSKALRHVFFAERQASRIDGVPKETPRIEIGRVGIIGAGTMGGGIAMNFLSTGIPVTMVERQEDALTRGVGIVRKNYDATAAKGRMTEDEVETAMGLLNPTLDFDALGDCDLVIEAVFENMDVKKDVFARLDKVAKKEAILATNTSYLDIDEIAAVTSRPEQVVGLHFFSPANIMKLLEIVRGEKTSDRVLATVMDLSRTIGKTAVVAGVCFGFIGNRMLEERQREAMNLVLEGASPWDVDRVLTAFGLPMGPFAMIDLAGVDIGWNPDDSSSSTVYEVLNERGRRGQKTGKGFYDYDDKRRASPSKETEEIIESFRKDGAVRTDISDREIRERLLYPMVNEGAKILDEKIAQRASDIDTVWINGYGWPAYTGGPMFWADLTGTRTILEGLERHENKLGEPFSISPYLRDLANRDGTFNG